MGGLRNFATTGRLAPIFSRNEHASKSSGLVFGYEKEPVSS